MRKPIVTSSLSFALVALASGCGNDLVLGGGSNDGGGGDNVWEFENPGVTIAPGEEFYHCFFRTVETGGTDDEEVGAVRFGYTPDSPALHHILIFSDPGYDGPDTDRECELLEGDWNPRYAGGTDTDDIVMPEGVAMPVRDRETFVIQYHYMNADPTQDIVDRTDAHVEFTDPGEEFIEASLIVSGNQDFQVPAGAVDYDVTGNCTVPDDLPISVNVFAVWPHMHQFGTWFNIETTLDGQTTTLWDEPWNFGDQPLRILDEPFKFGTGDSIDTTCRYTNPDEGAPITWGESSTQEMCFDFFFYYPSLATQMLPCMEGVF